MTGLANIGHPVLDLGHTQEVLASRRHQMIALSKTRPIHAMLAARGSGVIAPTATMMTRTTSLRSEGRKDWTLTPTRALRWRDFWHVLFTSTTLCGIRNRISRRRNTEVVQAAILSISTERS